MVSLLRCGSKLQFFLGRLRNRATHTANVFIAFSWLGSLPGACEQSKTLLRRACLRGLQVGALLDELEVQARLHALNCALQRGPPRQLLRAPRLCLQGSTVQVTLAQLTAAALLQT